MQDEDTEGRAVTGGCLCGAVTYAARPPFLRLVHCHCRRCRKATGTGHATNLYVPFDSLEWTAGEAEAARYDLPTARSFATTFCRQCGSPLPHYTRSRREFVIPVGSLDEEPPLPPQGRIFWDSRASWTCIDDLPRYGDYPDWWRRG